MFISVRTLWLHAFRLIAALLCGSAINGAEPPGVLITNIIGRGRIAALSSESSDSNSIVRLEAQPKAGWNFGKWSGATNTSSAQIDLAVTGDAAVTAEFFRFEGYAGSGGQVIANTNDQTTISSQVELIARPTILYGFSQWQDGSRANPRVITITAGRNAYTAVFTNSAPITENFTVAVPTVVPSYIDNRNTHLFSALSNGDWLHQHMFSGAPVVSQSPFHAISRYGRDGRLQWKHTLGAHPSAPLVLIESEDDGILIASPQAVSLLNANGTFEWSRAIPVAFDSTGRSVSQDSMGHVWLAGRRSNKLSITKLSQHGVHLWSQDLEVLPTTVRIVCANDGGALAYGQQSGANQSWAARLSEHGAMLWEQSYPIVAQECIETSGGWVFGWTATTAPAFSPASPSFGSNDVRLHKIDSNGASVADVAYGGAGHDRFVRFATNALGDWFVIATSASDAGPGKKSLKASSGEGSWILKTDDDLVAVWDVTFPRVALNEQLGNFAIAPRGASLSVNRDGSVRYFGAIGQADALLGRTLPYESIHLNRHGEIVAYSYFPVSADQYPSTLATTADDENWLIRIFGFAAQYLVTLAIEPAAEAPGTPKILTSHSFSGFGTWSAQVSLHSSFVNGVIYYTLDGSSPTTNSLQYSTPFTVSRKLTIRALAISADGSQRAFSEPVVVAETWKIGVSLEGDRIRIAAPHPASYYVDRKNAFSNSGWETIGEFDGYEIFIPSSESTSFFRLRKR